MEYSANITAIQYVDDTLLISNVNKPENAQDQMWQLQNCLTGFVTVVHYKTYKLQPMLFLPQKFMLIGLAYYS